MRDSEKKLKESSTNSELFASIEEQDVQPQKWTAEHEGYIEHNDDTIIICLCSECAGYASEDMDDISSKKELEIVLNISIANNFGKIFVGSKILLNFGIPTYNAVQEMKSKIQDEEDPDNTTKLEQLAFYNKLLYVGQSKAKVHNRSEFCHGQVVVTSTSEGDCRNTDIKVYSAADQQLVHIENNSGIIIIITDYGKSCKDRSSQSNEMSHSLNVANNCGCIVLGDNTRLNVYDNLSNPEKNYSQYK